MFRPFMPKLQLALLILLTGITVAQIATVVLFWISYMNKERPTVSANATSPSVKQPPVDPKAGSVTQPPAKQDKQPPVDPDQAKDKASAPGAEAPQTGDGAAQPPNDAKPSTEDGEKALPSAFEKPWPPKLNIVKEEQSTNPLVDQLLAACSDEKAIHEIVKKYHGQFAQEENGAWLFLDAKEYSNVWVVGDVHASVNSLARICSLLQQKIATIEGNHALVLLGDILDRGDKTAETVAFTCNLLMEHLSKPNLKVFYIRGNNDVGLYRKEDGTYASRVSPAESADCLNRLRMQNPQYADALANAAMLMARISPCMIELYGFSSQCPKRSIMLMHGGLPHTDLQEKIKDFKGYYFLDSPAREKLETEVMEDFTWIRLVSALPRKRPNRCSKGSEMGTQDVNAFRELHFQRTGHIISYIIRGHDHHKKGYELYSYDAQVNPNTNKHVQRNCGVLTINAMEDADAISLAHLQKDMEAVELHALPNNTTTSKPA